MTEPIPGNGDPSPKPEAPKGGIKVEVRQSDLIYSLVKKQVSGEIADSGIDIGSTEFDDNIFSNQRTSIHSFKKNYGKSNGFGANPRIDGTYNIGSYVYLSDKRKTGNDEGFFDQGRIQKIKLILEQKGYKATISEYWWKDKHGVIIVEKDGFFTEAHFGWFSRKDHEEDTLKKVEAEEKRGEKDSFYTKYELPGMKAGYTNNLVSIGLVDRVRAQTGYEGYIPLQDQDNFEKSLAVYTELYEKIMESTYEEDGKIPPDKTIVFRPPILNQDTVAEIKSVETDNPVPITEQQTIRDTTSFDEIAGQEVPVAMAKRLVLGINHPEVFERRGVKSPKGILFYGPPGTGKTMLAEAVANEANADFFPITAADIGTKWYGESENLIQKVFDRANASVKAGRKVILYFDELDALAPNREGANEATQKVIPVMLQNMDGMKANPNVTVIASTNRPEAIDPALRRPGRFDKLIYVGLPSVDGREKTLNVHMEKAKKTATAPGELFAPDIDSAQIAQLTEGLSGADLANLINLALEENTVEELEGKPWRPVGTRDLETMAKRLGNIKEEKQRMGFIPKTKNGNGSTSVANSQ